MPDEGSVADCLFCKIVSGAIPAALVHEGDDFVAFRDIDPKAPTHVLVIPRKHYTSLNDVDDAQLMGRLMLAARDVARAEGITEAGYRVVLNTNEAGGQSVFHIHAHVLGGRSMGWPPG